LKFNPDKPTLIVDSNSLCYRSFFTLPELSVQEVPVFVIFGFARQMLSLSKEFKTNQFIFCWDSKENHRKEIFPDYKKKRREKKDPDDTAKLMVAFNQFNFIRRKFLPLLGFKNIFCQKGFEADDLIAYLVQYWNDREFVIVSSDADLYQCLNDSVSQWTYKRLVTKKNFIKKYGAEPEVWATAKAIGGCNSDGVPGIRGVADPAKSKSEKMPAIKLAMKAEVSENLLKKFNEPENQKIIERNLQLVSLPLETEEYKLNHMELIDDELTKEKFWILFQSMEFASFLKKFEEWEDNFELGQ